MGFKIAARAILHLGAELISSDAIALFELVKNSYDAGSNDGVTVSVVITLPNWVSKWRAFFSELEGSPKKPPLASLKQQLSADCDRRHPSTLQWLKEIEGCSSYQDLQYIASRANHIKVTDTGCGMSLEDLDRAYLTIGTNNKYLERKSKETALLGEKGIGRLSSMRLGRLLEVKTSKAGNPNWNKLTIDWDQFSHQSNALLEEIDFSPARGEKKSDTTTSGTEIAIYNLNADWTKEKLRDFSQKQLSKFQNPFDASDKYRITLKYNDERIPVPEFDSLILNNAQAEFTASTAIDEKGQYQLTGEIYYKHRNRRTAFLIEESSICSICDCSPFVLKRLGPFFAQGSWFNRQLLRSKFDGGVEISKVVNDWSGGLMLFKDGFRVAPYGEANDDWLGLDEKALASQGYKVNRKQIIGRVEISSKNNLGLEEQSNREGIMDSPEKTALINLLKHLLEVRLRRFLNLVDQEEDRALEGNIGTISSRAKAQRTKLKQNLSELKRRYPAIKKERDLWEAIDTSLGELEQLINTSKKIAKSLENGRTEVIHLAGLGLMAEFLVHELNRTTEHALRTLARGGILSPQQIRTLELELKTLQKRLSVIDPSTTSGRQRKERFDLVEAINDVVIGHAMEFEREKITCNVVRAGSTKRGPIYVTMVKGMLIQVIENLLNNSSYWLRQQRLRNPSRPSIITIDADASGFTVSDSGPGIPVADREAVFQPFFTTKPPGEGKGLGLYISREIAKYHECDLRLSDLEGLWGNLNTFTFTLP